ncbi:hypothetical protein B5X24_HaOG202050 [Helicoverpa armigera]|uniref:Uncharacterized protein n=1 Tax=Helicoverpa armigera TaxID=29058 RepID=A0A2W1BW75_HELAM|nr:hypothetical protein B5X24_HaOG202050 [Helicoverpa armigera]
MALVFWSGEECAFRRRGGDSLACLVPRASPGDAGRGPAPATLHFLIVSHAHLLINHTTYIHFVFGNILHNKFL